MMTGSPADARIRRRSRRRAAAFGIGLMAATGAAALALSPLIPTVNPAIAGLPQQTAQGAAVALIQQQSFAPLVKKVLPAVVNISVTQTEPGAEEMSQQGRLAPFPDFRGSPFDEFLRRFFVDPSGYIVTNNHVIGSAGKIVVILQNNRKYKAKIVGRDPRTDIAVLKIDAKHPLPYVEFGDSSAAQVGDWVMAVGNPFGLGGTVTTGIISARGRDIHSGPFDDFLQIDAPINRGNSGGPTFNLSGQVIGINTAIYSPNGGSVGIGFAIPSNAAKPVVEQLEK